jgi:1-acyl-sn-glycerol-3-phosphate acyltransferase
MNTYHIKSQPLKMLVGDPISTQGLTLRDFPAITEKVKAAMEALYYGN